MTLTHPDRVIDPSTGATKGDVARYYEGVADRLLAGLRGRPVALLRAPHGVGGESFFQRHPAAAAAGWAGVQPLDPALWPGHEPLLDIHSAEGLMSAVQMNVLEFHTWNAKLPRLDRPDRLVFDLDPGEGVGWDDVVEAANRVRDALARLDLDAALKTSGGRGLHLVVPIAARWPVAQVRTVARAFVTRLAEDHPGQFVARSGAEHRVGRIFIDWLRNGEGATTVAAFSLRARPGLGVSMPLAWGELPGLAGPTAWSWREVLARLQAGRWSHPWSALRSQSLATAIRHLGPWSAEA